MHVIDKLIAAAQERRVKIAVCGDYISDIWIGGRLEGCQDGCPKFAQESFEETPGGASNAVRQLQNWNAAAAAHLFANEMAVSKTRYVVDSKIVFRVDDDQMEPEELLQELRRSALRQLEEFPPDAVLLADYCKGFLTDELIRQVIARCRAAGVPVVADAKRAPEVYAGAIIQGNLEYYQRYRGKMPPGHAIVTRGAETPFVCSWDLESWHRETGPAMLPVECRNHVGAGDCFAAHLTLAVAHGLPLEDAAAVAHSAGRVYVQFPHSRPPWPHEVRRDLLGAAGKIIPASWAGMLSTSMEGRRLVFTCGCFDLLGPHHAYVVAEARRRGDVLAVGVNDDESVRRLKGPRRPLLPLAERCAVLAALGAVDWVIPFAGDTPAALLAELRPDVRVGARLPDRDGRGDEFCGRVELVEPVAGWSTSALVERVRQ